MQTHVQVQFIHSLLAMKDKIFSLKDIIAATNQTTDRAANAANTAIEIGSLKRIAINQYMLTEQGIACGELYARTDERYHKILFVSHFIYVGAIAVASCIINSNGCTNRRAIDKKIESLCVEKDITRPLTARSYFAVSNGGSILKVFEKLGWLRADPGYKGMYYSSRVNEFSDFLTNITEWSELMNVFQPRTAIKYNPIRYQAYNSHLLKYSEIIESDTYFNYRGLKVIRDKLGANRRYCMAYLKSQIGLKELDIDGQKLYCCSESIYDSYVFTKICQEHDIVPLAAISQACRNIFNAIYKKMGKRLVKESFSVLISTKELSEQLGVTRMSIADRFAIDVDNQKYPADKAFWKYLIDKGIIRLTDQSPPNSANSMILFQVIDIDAYISVCLIVDRGEEVAKALETNFS